MENKRFDSVSYCWWERICIDVLIYVLIKRSVCYWSLK